MPYCWFQLFNEMSHKEERFQRLRAEMMPKLQAVPGFQRWSGFETEDARYGGFQVYDTRQGMEQARQMFDDWRRSIGATEPLDMEGTGEIGLSIAMQTDFETAYAVMRLYRDAGSFAEVNEAIEHEGGDTIRGMPGLYRYTTAALDDGRLGVFSAYATEAAAHAMTAKARELRGRPGSKLAKLLPVDPEVISGRVPMAFGPAKAAAHA